MSIKNIISILVSRLFHHSLLYSPLLVFIGQVSQGQELPAPNNLNSHDDYIQILRNSETDFYFKVISKYDAYILKYPQDLRVQVERCRFMNEAMYNSYEEYNPNQLQFDTCLQELSETYGNDLRVMNFASEFLYGDTAISLLEEIIGQIEGDDIQLSEDLDIAAIYERAANNYSYAENHTSALNYAEKAVAISDSLNLSYFIASELKELGQLERAQKILIEGKDSTLESWRLNQIAVLALELGNSEFAVCNFTWATLDEDGWISHNKYAEALIQEEQYEEGRKQLKIGADQTWTNIETLFDLFEYDLKYMSTDTAVATYEKMRSEGWQIDAFGISRSRLLIQKGYWNIKWRDGLGPLFFLFVIAILFLLPYLWILPIQAIGNYRKASGVKIEFNHFRWGLRHFWWLSFGYFFVSFLIMLIFYHEGMIRYMFYDLVEAMTPAIDSLTSTSGLSFIIGIIIVVLFLTKSSDLKLFNTDKWGHAKAIGLALGSVFLLRVFLVITTGLLDINGAPGSFEIGLLSASIEIQAMLVYLGVIPTFLIISVLVPIYEEIMFRGIILGACEKNIGFLWANIFQAGIFAIVHFNTELLLFYFVFAIIAGLLRQKSQSLNASIYMHVINNAIVILYLSVIT